MAPITKSTDSEGKKTVRVLDGEGSRIGVTYPRRAAGLVKKGRAYYVNDFIIRLSMSDAMLPDSIQKSEVMKMDNRTIIDNTRNETEAQVLKLYFEPRTWSFNKDCEHNVGGRSFMMGPDGVLAESYMLGDWGYNWTEIVSKTLLLPKNTDCSFTFWLNGGENDRNDEVCRFEVVFNNDYEQRLTYNLNRNYIPPVKKLNGWELYEIPFRTQDNEYTQLRFVAQKAYMTVMSAKEAAAYEGMTGGADPFEGERPQRHNIVFDDGFPTNKWYGTKNLQQAHKNQGAKDSAKYQYIYADRQNNDSANAGTHMADFDVNEFASAVEQVFDKLQQLSGEMRTSTNMKLGQITASLDTLSSTCDMLENFDVEVLADSIKTGEEESDEHINDIVSEASDSLSDMADGLRDNIEEIADQIEEIRDALSM